MFMYSYKLQSCKHTYLIYITVGYRTLKIPTHLRVYITAADTLIKYILMCDMKLQSG